MVIGQIAGMTGTVYILKSESNGRYYIGSTNNLARREEEHGRGKTKYTKIAGPFELVFKQEFVDIKLARQIEYKLKKLKSRVIIEKIINEGVIKLGP